MRRHARETGSLDLLLDTVTNTFGGVFFVAVLVTMLLRVTQPKATVSDQRDERRQSQLHKQTRDARQAELRGLEAALSQHQSLLDTFTTTDGRRDYEDLAKLRGRFEQLAKDRIDLQFKVSSLQGSLLESRTREVATQLNVASELRRNEELEGLIAQEQTSRTRTVALPTLRKTDKNEFSFIVRYGRLYSAYVPDALLLKRRHLDEFVVVGDKEGAVGVTPKPYRGIALEDSAQCAEEVRLRLNGIDKSRCYIAVAVWEDSFEEFAHLRRILVDEEYEYRLLPIPSEQVIWEGGSGEKFVQ
jgi:hypothetical protein